MNPSEAVGPRQSRRRQYPCKAVPGRNGQIPLQAAIAGRKKGERSNGRPQAIQGQK